MAGHAVCGVEFCSGINGLLLTRERILAAHRGCGGVMKVGVLRGRNSRDKAERDDKKTGASSHVQASLRQLLFSAAHRKTTPTLARAGGSLQVSGKITLALTFPLDAERRHIGAVTILLACHAATGEV